MAVPNSTTPWIDTIADASRAMPFSFTYDGKASSEILSTWRITRSSKRTRDRTVATTMWTDPATGLRLKCEMTRFPEAAAVDWVLRFENTGKADTPIIENIQAMDVTLDAPISGAEPYLLHRTNGSPANASDFEPSTVALSAGKCETMGGGGGRSSNRDFPFFKVEAGDRSRIFAVGWSGQWAARLDCLEGGKLHVTAGMERTHFVLRAGESVRSPRILVLHTTGDTLECNARFRELLQKHYAAKRAAKTPAPTLFCNTCFTRGGGWLNECNAENQISLIKAYAPLGLEALITDAGWFEGGWPPAASNWARTTPARKTSSSSLNPS